MTIVAFYRHSGSGDGWKHAIDEKNLDTDRPLKLELVDQSLIVPRDMRTNRAR